MTVLYCDSSSTEACVHDGEGYALIAYNRRIPDQFKNVGEYRAVIEAMKFAQFFHTKDIEIRTDSQLVVRQVNGEYRCNRHYLRALRNRVHKRSKEFNSFKLTWVNREDNPAGLVLQRRK